MKPIHKILRDKVDDELVSLLKATHKYLLAGFADSQLVDGIKEANENNAPLYMNEEDARCYFNETISILYAVHRTRKRAFIFKLCLQCWSIVEHTNKGRIQNTHNNEVYFSQFFGVWPNFANDTDFYDLMIQNLFECPKYRQMLIEFQHIVYNPGNIVLIKKLQFNGPCIDYEREFPKMKEIYSKSDIQEEIITLFGTSSKPMIRAFLNTRFHACLQELNEQNYTFLSAKYTISYFNELIDILVQMHACGFHCPKYNFNFKLCLDCWCLYYNNKHYKKSHQKVINFYEFYNTKAPKSIRDPTYFDLLNHYVLSHKKFSKLLLNRGHLRRTTNGIAIRKLRLNSKACIMWEVENDSSKSCFQKNISWYQDDVFLDGEMTELKKLKKEIN